MDDARAPQDRHVPVMLERCVELLEPALRRPGSVLVDGTLGMGGHSHALLRACPNAHLIGIDRDPQALRLAGQRLAEFAGRFDLVHAVHDQLPEVLADLGHSRADAVLLDLGVSSLQLDEPDRGFAYSRDVPLDMRMDPTTGPSAAYVVNTYPVPELTRVLREYGEERFARRIAQAIDAERRREPFSTSARLVAVVRDSVPAAGRRTGGNPAKRTFQALRIEVNGELTTLAEAIPVALQALRVGGRIVVMSYHSLEDRIVKRAMAVGSRSSAPPGLPVELPEHRPWLRLLTRGAEVATEQEIEANPRSASVRLRAAERLAETGPEPGRDRSVGEVRGRRQKRSKNREDAA